MVVARDEADVIAVAGCAARRGVPLVARGAGTGNYGQAVPLRGGIVLDLSKLSGVVHFDATEGVVRAGAGANLGELEDLVRVSGWELRQHPSTRRTATLGGFIAGGSTGVGALLHGGLAEDGAIMARLGLSHGWPGAGNTDTRNQTRNYRRPLDPKRSKPSRETVRGKRVCCADPIHLFTVTQCRVSLLPPTRARPVSVRVRSRSLSLRRDRVAPPPTGAARGHRGASAPGPGADRARCVPRVERVLVTRWLWQRPHSRWDAVATFPTLTAAWFALELVQHLDVVRFGGRVGFASLALLTPKGASKECRADR